MRYFIDKDKDIWIFDENGELNKFFIWTKGNCYIQDELYGDETIESIIKSWNAVEITKKEAFMKLL